MQEGRVDFFLVILMREWAATDVDDVIRMFGEETCNASGKRLISCE